MYRLIAEKTMLWVILVAVVLTALAVVINRNVVQKWSLKTRVYLLKILLVIEIIAIIAVTPFLIISIINGERESTGFVAEILGERTMTEFFALLFFGLLAGIAVTCYTIWYEKTGKPAWYDSFWPRKEEETQNEQEKK